MLISLRVNHKVTTFPSGLTLQYPQSPCRRRRVLFSWDSWNLRRASWPEWSVLRPGIRIEKLDFTINSVISSDTGQGNDAPRTERALCFRPNEPKIKKEPERVPEARCVWHLRWLFLRANRGVQWSKKIVSSPLLKETPDMCELYSVLKDKSR